MTSQTLLRLTALLAAVGILVTGHGLLTLLVPVRAADFGIGETAVGIIGSVYFAGFVFGSVIALRLLRRVGHIRSFATAVAIAIVAALVLPLYGNAYAWGASRFLFGIAIAVIYTVIESWLNEASDSDSRGLTLAVYATLVSVSYGVGQALGGVLPEGDRAAAFLYAGIILALATLPAMLTRAEQPIVPAAVKIDMRHVITISPAGAMGALLSGVGSGALWVLGPIYAHAIEMPPALIGGFMGAFVFGGAVAVVPLGRLSDRIDRRKVIVALSALTALASLVVAFGPGLYGGEAIDLPSSAVIGFAGLFGAVFLPVHAISVAHANDHADPEDFVGLAGALLILLGIGSVIGPLLAAYAITLLGPGGLFAHIAGAALLLAAFTAIRMRQRTAPDETVDFAQTPKTTPLALVLDPRGEDSEDGPDDAAPVVSQDAPLTSVQGDPAAQQTPETEAQMSNPSIAAKDGSGSFGGYLALPPGGSGPGLVVIQEIFGVNEVMRKITDQFAALGFVAFCPDIFWRIEPGIQITDKTQEEWDRAFELFGQYDQDKGVEDLQAAVDFLRGHAATNGKVGCVGFCLGGRMVFRMALETDVDAAVSYYGVGLEGLVDRADKITAPTVLHIAAKDSFVPPEAQQAIKDALAGHDKVTIYIYDEDDHAFAREGGQHYNADSAKLALDRSMDVLGALR